MSSNDESPYDSKLVNSMVESALRIALIFGLLAISFSIIQPFITPIAWGGILAVALMPVTRWVQRRVGDRQGLAATLVTLTGVLLLLGPSILVTESLIDTGQELAEAFNEGDVKIDPPPARVAEWPVIGKPVFDAWTLANQNLEAALTQFESQLTAAASWLLGKLGNTALSVLLFIVSLAIAGFFMAKSAPVKAGLDRFAVRVLGDDGNEWVDMCGATIRSVVQGVLGVAIIQALAAAIGLFLMDVPATGLWVILILLLAIMQLPPLLILGPIAAYVFSYADTTPAVIFLVYALIISGSDAFLKPMLLGRGLDVPMPVILIGAIGGMMTAGIIGLFAGAVVLAIWYRLFIFWLTPGIDRGKDTQAAESTGT
jgi:predicted PurR-regulated permease PerM